MKTLQNYKEGFVMPPQGFIYDPAIKGYDNSFWADVTGTPALSSGKIRLNQAAMASFIQVTVGKLFIEASLPAVPTAGDDRFIGFGIPTQGTAIGFLFDDGDVKAVINAPVMGSTWELTLNPALFTIANHDFTIDWNDGSVAFYVDGDCVAVCEDATIMRQVKESVFALYLSNNNSDNVDVSIINLTEAGRIN